MTLQIPLFPLDMILFPGEEVELHVFEDRYKTMFNELIENAGKAGIIRKLKGDTFGTIGTLFSVKEVVNTYKTGEMDVLIQGEDLFELKHFNEFTEEKVYPVGEIEKYPCEVFTKVPAQLLTLANETMRVVTGNENRPWSSLLLMTDMLQVLQLNVEVREEFMTSIKNQQWVSFIAGQMRLFISIQRQMRQLRGNVQLN